MVNYHLSNKAVADLSDIWNYTCETWSQQQADKYYFMMLDTCKELAEKPGKGKNYDQIYQSLKGYKVYQHIIFYLAVADGIEIIRILHSRMDLKNRLND